MLEASILISGPDFHLIVATTEVLALRLVWLEPVERHRGTRTGKTNQLRAATITLL